MAADGKKGITVKVDAALHAEITQYLQDHGMTMTEFVTLALQDELHPKIDEKEGKNMEKMRTLAFQVPESLFQRIKDYLHRNNMTQKDFVIGLIEQELDRDLAESQETGEAQGDFEDTEELEDTEQLDADQELLEDTETASSAEEMDEAEPSISDQEEPETSEEGPDAEELDDEMSSLEEKGESEDQDDEDKVLRLIKSEDLRDDEGKLFKFSSHMFRRSYGVKLTELHLDDWTIAKLLGHKNISAVKHYRKMSNQLLAEETRKAREQQTRILLANLDGWGEEYEQIRQDD